MLHSASNGIGEGKGQLCILPVNGRGSFRRSRSRYEPASRYRIVEFLHHFAPPENVWSRSSRTPDERRDSAGGRFATRGIRLLCTRHRVLHLAGRRPGLLLDLRHLAKLTGAAVYVGNQRDANEIPLVSMAAAGSRRKSFFWMAARCRNRGWRLRRRNWNRWWTRLMNSRW